MKRRCGRCDRRSGLYDRGDGRRRWRALDAGTIRVFIDADAPRSEKCCVCGWEVRGSGRSSGSLVSTARRCAATWRPGRSVWPVTAVLASCLMWCSRSFVRIAVMVMVRVGRVLEANRSKIAGWLDAGVKTVKIGELLARDGVVVAERTLHRSSPTNLARGRGKRSTVPIADGEPAAKCSSTSPGSVCWMTARPAGAAPDITALGIQVSLLDRPASRMSAFEEPGQVGKLAAPCLCALRLLTATSCICSR